MTPEIVTTDSPRSGTARSPPPLTPTNAQLTGQATPSGNQGQGHENIFRRALVKSPIIRLSVSLSRSRRPRGITRVGFLLKSTARSAGRWRPRASDSFPISSHSGIGEHSVGQREAPLEPPEQSSTGAGVAPARRSSKPDTKPSRALRFLEAWRRPYPLGGAEPCQPTPLFVLSTRHPLSRERRPM